MVAASRQYFNIRVRRSQRGGGWPLLPSASRLVRPASAPLRMTAEMVGVRSPSAVAPAAVSTRQRRQPLDLLIVKVANAVNVNKRPVRLVRIE
jgi:hypothetical protein